MLLLLLVVNLRHNTHTHTHTHTHTQRERVSERERNTHMRSHKLRQREREGEKKGGDRQTDRQTDRQRLCETERQHIRHENTRLIKQAQPTVPRQRSQGFNPAVQTPVQTPFDTQTQSSPPLRQDPAPIPRQQQQRQSLSIRTPTGAPCIPTKGDKTAPTSTTKASPGNRTRGEGRAVKAGGRAEKLCELLARRRGERQGARKS